MSGNVTLGGSNKGKYDSALSVVTPKNQSPIKSQATSKSDPSQNISTNISSDMTQASSPINAISALSANNRMRAKISFVPSRVSRDLFLYENDKPAVSRTYYFQFQGEKFPGVVTDNLGRIYLYDRANNFHRPLKHLVRQRDEFSNYHAGFREKTGVKDQRSNNYIDLGSLEVLQAALHSSDGARNIVEISGNSIEDDGFMVNWMLATSPSESHRARYWNDNVLKLRNKSNRNWENVLYPILFAAPFIGTITGLGIALENQLGDNNSPNVNLQEPGKIALAATIPAAGVGLGTYGATKWHENQRQKRDSENTDNLLRSEDAFSDI